MARLLVVHHTVSPATEALLAAALKGARDPLISGVEVVPRPALVTSAVEALEADGYLLGSPVNIGYISGALKHFFDTVYYPCLTATRGRPYGLWLHAGGDANGALRAVDAITAGLGWKAAQAPVVVTGTPASEDLAAVGEMAAAVAAGLMPD